MIFLLFLQGNFVWTGPTPGRTVVIPAEFRVVRIEAE